LAKYSKVTLVFYKKIFFGIFFFTLIYSIDTFRHLKNITSLLTTNSIKKIDDNRFLIATTGGLYEYNSTNSVFNNYTNKLRYIDINGIEIVDSYIWLFGNDANIQILDADFNLLDSISFDAFDNIHKILFYDQYVFAIVSDQNGQYLAQLSNIGTPYYLNKYNSFNIDDTYVTINNLNDIYIKDDIIYLATDLGVIKANLDNNNNNNNLSLLLDWYFEISFETIGIHEDNLDNMFYTYYENSELCNSNTNACMNYNLSDYINSFYYQGSSYLLFNDILYKDNAGVFNIVFELPHNIKSSFRTVSVFQNIFYFGLENHGVLYFNENTGISDFILPNTLISYNKIESIDVNENNFLVASIDSSAGGFIIKNVLSNELIKNFYAESENYFSEDGDDYHETYKLKYPNVITSNSNHYYGKKIPYISGKKPNSIKLDNNNNIYFTNSGIYMQADEFHQPAYDPFKDYIEYLSGLLYIHSDNVEIINGWDEEFSGIMDIYPPADGNNYTQLNQIIFDDENNLFIVNPYSELNKPIAIKYNENDFEWIEDNSQNFHLLPQEIAIDYHKNLWIAYQKDDNPSLSPGGIRVVQLGDIDNSDDDIWRNNPLDIIEEDNCYIKPQDPNLNISLEDNDGNPISVWSIDIGSDEYGHTLLWVVSDYGVMAYVITEYEYSQGQGYLQQINMIPIRCNFYFSELSFNESSKIRVDKQNNAWIINEQGVRIIKSNGEIFPDEFILDEISENLLSHSISDIVFDNRGYVYIATDKGISIFESSFSRDVEINKISVSPNPFIIGDNTGLTISNFPSKSTIHIMNLSGRIVKKIDVENENVIINWDGRGDDNKFLSTGIYLVAGMDNNNSFGVTKLAIVRK